MGSRVEKTSSKVVAGRMAGKTVAGRPGGPTFTYK